MASTSRVFGKEGAFDIHHASPWSPVPMKSGRGTPAGSIVKAAINSLAI